MHRRIDDLASYVNTLVGLYVQTHQKVEILESLATHDLVDRLNPSYGANAFDALVNVLIQDIIRSTWALALDKAKTTPSVVNIWRLASHPDALPALRSRFVSAQPPEPARGPEQFDEAVVRLQQSVQVATTGPQAERFTRARNKAIAHHEMQRQAERGLQLFDLRSVAIGWDGFREYVESLAPLVQDLALVITGAQYRLADVHEHHRMNVLDFWMRIMGTGSITPT